MTVYDCLNAGIVNPLTIAQRTGKKLPHVSAELIKLSQRLGEQFAKQMLQMQPLQKPQAQLRTALSRLNKGMIDEDSLVLEAALQGILNYKKAAILTGLTEGGVRRARSRMLRLARLGSFEEVVRLVLYPEGPPKKARKAGKK